VSSPRKGDNQELHDWHDGVNLTDVNRNTCMYYNQSAGG